jgi:uncharacterized protein (TIGR01370 family)
MKPVPPVRNTLISMRRLAAIVAVVILAGAALAFGASPPAPADEAADAARASVPASTFAFAIGNGMLDGSAGATADRLGRFDLVVVDGEEVTTADITALHGRGTTVLAYLSVGTIESYRSWYAKLKAYRLEPLDDWADEWYAAVAKSGFRNAIANDVAPSILAKGADGLFLDNVDMIETHSGQRAGMKALVSALSTRVHGDGRLLFAQNGHLTFARQGIFPLLDGWNREDVTWTYDFDRRRYVRNPQAEIDANLAEVRNAVARGLIVTTTDYTAGSDTKALTESVANSCGAGALPYVSDIGLSAKRLPNPALTCPAAR